MLSCFVLLVLVLSSCKKSEKGSWSEADKQAFYKEMAKFDLSRFGNNKSNWLECYLNKGEANYSSFSEMNSDTEGCKKLGHECSVETMSNGSVKGKWSDLDKQAFYDEMSKLNLSSFGLNKVNFLECYLSKGEANYSSFFEMNSDENGCTLLSYECSIETKNKHFIYCSVYYRYYIPKSGINGLEPYLEEEGNYCSQIVEISENEIPRFNEKFRNSYAFSSSSEYGINTDRNTFKINRYNSYEEALSDKNKNCMKELEVIF